MSRLQPLKCSCIMETTNVGAQKSDLNIFFGWFNYSNKDGTINSRTPILINWILRYRPWLVIATNNHNYQFDWLVSIWLVFWTLLFSGHIRWTSQLPKCLSKFYQGLCDNEKHFGHKFFPAILCEDLEWTTYFSLKYICTNFSFFRYIETIVGICSTKILFRKNFVIFKGKTCLGVLFWEVKIIQKSYFVEYLCITAFDCMNHQWFAFTAAEV